MNFTDMRVGETEIFTVDYADLLGAGETILTADWSVIVQAGDDPDPEAMIIGFASIEGSKVSGKLTGRVANVWYWPTCTAVTSQGQTLVLPDPGEGSLKVVP